MYDVYCEECGCLVEDDYYLCYWCAQRQEAIEAQIRNMREERDERSIGWDWRENYVKGADITKEQYEAEMSELRNRVGPGADGGTGLEDQRNKE